jgi:hypothetical protein
MDSRRAVRRQMHSLLTTVAAAIMLICCWIFLMPAESLNKRFSKQKTAYCSASDLELPNIGFNVSGQHQIVSVLPRGCLLQRYENNTEAALSSLRGKHLVLIGDSVTRYMYLSLVYFLETGNFSSSFPSQTWEKDYSSWKQFFQAFNPHHITPS